MAGGITPAPCLPLIHLVSGYSSLSLEAPHSSLHLRGASSAAPAVPAPGVEELDTRPVCAQRGWVQPIKPP